MSVFILENISKSFVVDKKENKVLNSISFSFPDSGLVSIIGKSGSGKSTLLNILMGIEKPTNGKVYFNKKDISKFKDRKFSDYHLNGVSLVFQHYNLFNDFSALENVILPLIMKGEKRSKAIAQAKELFKRFNIENLVERKVNNLSGGEKQRIAILRSLITKPKAILCDEPTGALDFKNSEEIMEILREISHKTLVIMVSHNKRLVDKYSDQILILKDGKINETIGYVSDKNTTANSKHKYRFSSTWIKKFLGKNFFKHFKKNFFSIIACSISFAAMFISVGFSEGSKSSQEEALNKNLSLGFATASESKFIEIEGSPLKYEKTTKPEIELVDEKFSDFESVRYEENLSYFISAYPMCTYESKNVSGFEMIPLYDSSLTNYGSDMLVEGSTCNNEFDEIIINEEFEKLLGESCVGKVINISNLASVNYETGDADRPFIKDTLNFEKSMKICGIIREFSFLNTPKIYYSYKGAKNFLKEEIMPNLSAYLGTKISYYDYLLDSKNDDPVSSYSCYLFLTDIKESEKFFERIKETQNSSLVVTSSALSTRETYGTFIGSFSSTLVIFVIIAFIGINFILGMISLSTFLENRKSTAVLTCLGARNSSIYKLYLSENYIVIFISFFLSVFLSIFLSNFLNPIIAKKFCLSNLISIPFSSYFGMPFALPIFICLIAVIFSTIFTLTPMYIYRHGSLSDELRDE